MIRHALLAALMLAAPKLSAQQGLRVLQWNVSDSAWVKHPAETRAALRGADPDILILVQVAPAIGAAGVRSMINGLRGPGDTTWFVSVRGEGDFEHSVIASRDSLRDLPEFASLTYPASGAAPDTAVARDRGNTIRANGVLARAGSRWILVAGVHLTCCGTAGTWREERRQLAATVIRERLRTAYARAKPSGVIVAGDMNLVSGRAAMDTLLGAMPAMRRADAFQPDGWTSWTWDGRGTVFNGGVLDNLLYSSGTLTATRARVWDTESSALINRHRPVVVDFAVTPTPLEHAHAHNDYEHARPLAEALEHGFTSIEADVFLVNGQLLVGHHRDSLSASRTLESLYLAPLRTYVQSHTQPLTLLIDVKSDSERTYVALDSLLRRYADLFTIYSHGAVIAGPVQAIISGERAIGTMRKAPVRYAAVDGRLPDLRAPSALVPLVSDSWDKLTKWKGAGAAPDSVRREVTRLAALAHRNGQRLRFWGTPDNEVVWTLLRDAGVDLIGADDLDALRAFLTRGAR